MLKIKDVKKYFDRRLVLEIFQLDLEKDMYGVKGENGSGKSTFLRMIAGVLPFDGQICFEDINVKRRSVEYRRHVSWADAEPLFPGFMTGQELLEFYRILRGATVQESRNLTEMLKMSEFIGLRIGTYSSGTLKKLSLLLAFIGNPSIISLDEPLITLDESSALIVCELVRQRTSSGTLVLLSSHLEIDALVSFSNKTLLVSNQTVNMI